jgi:hypothetical protein
VSGAGPGQPLYAGSHKRSAGAFRAVIRTGAPRWGRRRGTVARRGDLWAIKMTKSKLTIIFLVYVFRLPRRASPRLSPRVDAGVAFPPQRRRSAEDGAATVTAGDPLGSATGPWSTLRKDEGDPTATRSFVLRVGFESHRR